MNVFFLSATSLEDDLLKMINSFWWGKKSGSTRGIIGCAGTN